MSNDRRTKAERLSSTLNKLDAMAQEVRQLTERTEKVSRRLIEVQYELAHIFDEEGNK
jgi:methyl-accepting chemotaxis protein